MFCWVVRSGEAHRQVGLEAGGCDDHRQLGLVMGEPGKPLVRALRGRSAVAVVDRQAAGGRIDPGLGPKPVTDDLVEAR